MLGGLLAALMAASFFMPWVEFFGQQIGPMMLLDEGMPPISDLPWQGWAFLSSFIVAAIAAILAMLQRPAGLAMLIAGAIPFGLIANQVLGVRDQAQDLGLPMPQSGNPQEALEFVQEFVALGLPSYFVSAALLVVFGLVRIVRGT